MNRPLDDEPESLLELLELQRFPLLSIVSFSITTGGYLETGGSLPTISTSSSIGSLPANLSATREPLD